MFVVFILGLFTGCCFTYLTMSPAPDPSSALYVTTERMSKRVFAALLQLVYRDKVLDDKNYILYNGSKLPLLTGKELYLDNTEVHGAIDRFLDKNLRSEEQLETFIQNIEAALKTVWSDF